MPRPFPHFSLPCVSQPARRRAPSFDRLEPDRGVRFRPIPATEIDKVAEGSQAKISSTLRQAEATVRATIAARGSGTDVERSRSPRLWQVDDHGAIQVYLWLTDLTEWREASWTGWASRSRAWNRP